jgi:hypothetical protein
MVSFQPCREVAMEMPVGERFARAIAAKDAPALLRLLAPQVEFRAMTPGRFWEADSAVDVVKDVILGHWFEPTDQIEGIDAIETGTVVDRERVSYRFRVTSDGAPYIVEQQAYLDVAPEGISWLRIMCSGYQPVEK